MVYKALLPHGYMISPYRFAIFFFETLLARASRRAEILPGRLLYNSFAKQLQRIAIKLVIRVYTNNFFGEFNFDFVLPSAKLIVTQVYVKL